MDGAVTTNTTDDWKPEM